MKKFAKVSVILLAFIMAFVSAISVSAAGKKTVYVSDSGDDSADGSETAPVQTLDAAYKLLGKDGGTVCAAGAVTISGEAGRSLCEAADSYGPVTLTAKKDALVTVTGAGLWLPTDTVIENIKFHFTYKDFNSYFVANCNKLVIGKGVEITKSDDAYGWPIIYGSGFYSFKYVKAGMKSDVTVKSGIFEEVYGGGGANGWGDHIDDVPGTSTVRILGGTVNTLFGGCNGTVGGTDPVVSYGDIFLEVSGGTVNHIVGNGKSTNAPVKGNISVKVTGGSVEDITVRAYNEKGEIVADGETAVDGTATISGYEKYIGLASGFDKTETLTPSADTGDRALAVLYASVTILAAGIAVKRKIRV